jgi:hypothetical protein
MAQCPTHTVTDIAFFVIIMTNGTAKSSKRSFFGEKCVKTTLRLKVVMEKVVTLWRK